MFAQPSGLRSGVSWTISRGRSMNVFVFLSFTPARANRVRTASVKPAPARRINWRRDVTLQHNPAAGRFDLRVRNWHGGNQRLRIWHERLSIDTLRFGQLDDFA